jgi:hypothetical protein
MTNGPRILVDLIIVTARHRFIAKEMDSVVLDAIGKVDVVLDVTKTVGFIPACGEDVEGDLATDGVSVSSLVRGPIMKIEEHRKRTSARDPGIPSSTPQQKQHESHAHHQKP